MKPILAPGQTARTVLEDSPGHDPFEALERLREAGRRKAKASAIAYKMDHERKVVLARIASELSQAHASQGMSEAKLERMARADPRYLQHIESTAYAIRDKEQAESDYWSIRAALEWDERAVSHLNALTRLEK